MCPLVEIWKVDLSGSIHMLTHFHLIQTKFNPKSPNLIWIPNPLAFCGSTSQSLSPHLHIRGRLDVAERCMIGVCVEEVQRDWDVVVLTPIGHRDRTLGRTLSIFCLYYKTYLNIDEVSLLSIIECELVLLRAEALVVVDQGLNLGCKNQYFCRRRIRWRGKETKPYLALGQLRVAIVDLISGGFILNQLGWQG